MKASLRQDYTGVLVGIAALAVVVILALFIQYSFVSPLVERERAALSKSLHLEQLINVLGANDKKTRSELTTHLTLLRDGGEFIALNSESYSMPAADSDELIGTVNAVELLLRQGRSSAVATLYSSVIAIQQGSWSNLTRKVNWFRYAVGFNALLILMFLCWQVFQLFSRTKALQNETINQNKHFLEATKDAVFFITRSKQIASVQSGAAKQVFGINQRISGDFFDFLKGLVSSSKLADAKEYVEQMLEGRSGYLNNPLDEVEISVETKMGEVSKKYVSFEFSRQRGDSNVGLLVSVKDITEEVRLTKKLAKSNRSLAKSVRNNEEKMSLLMSSIVEDSDQTREFFASAHKGLREIINLLRDREPSSNHAQKLKRLRRRVRRIKHAAGSVGLPLIETSTGMFDAKLKKMLEHTDDVTDMQVLALTEHVRKLVSELDFLEQFNAKNNAQKDRLASTNSTRAASVLKNKVKRSSTTATSSSSSNDQSSRLKLFAKEIAARQNKSVRVKKSGFDKIVIDAAAEAKIESLCIQLINNAITHAIELPKKRRKLGKPSEGLITINIKARDKKRVLLRMRNDGVGFDLSAILKAVIEQGLLEDAAIKKMSKPELIRVLFRTGFSISGYWDDDDSDGLGLDGVKSAVNKLGGKIRVKSFRGISSQVTIQLSLAALSSNSEKNRESAHSYSEKVNDGVRGQAS